MSKHLFFALLLMASFAVSAQTVEFGIQAGYTSIEGESSSSSDDVSYSGNSSGFFLGAVFDFTLSEKFHLQPSVNYANADETNFIVVPLLAQYYIENSGFYLLGGPQATIFLDNYSIENIEFFNDLGIDLAFGAGYAITDNFFIEARYSFELTNRYTKEIRDAAGSTDIDAGFNALSIGVGYKF